MTSTEGPGHTVGAVLIGGASRRMGVDKATLAVGGTAMAERVARAMESAGVDDVVTVGGPDRGLGRPHLVDRFPAEGPLGGIISALSGLDATFVLVTACDLPWVTPSVFESIRSGIGDADVSMARSVRPEPTCALWRRSTCTAHLERAFEAGERAVHRAIAGLGVVWVDVEASALRNVNTPDDLQGH